MKQTDWQTLAARLFCYTVGIVLAYVGIEYLLPVILPLAMAFGVSCIVSSIAKSINAKTGIPRGACAFFIVTIMISCVGVAVFFACRQLINEAKRMVDVLSVEGISALHPALEGLEKIPALYRLAEGSEELAGSLTPMISNALTALVSHLGAMLGSVIRSTPTAFIGGVVTVLFIYYASVDHDRIMSAVLSVLPQWWRDRFSSARRTVLHIGMSYLRAYAIIFVLTFIEIFLGLLILCPSYSLLGALFIAAVDILPVFGAGFVLIPWGIISLLSGDIFVGVGLLVLYLVVTVVRQIAEPHILGDSMGVHPLLTLTGMYLGYRLFGFSGMIIAPIAIFTAMGALRQRRLNGKAAVNTDDLSRNK